MQQPHDNTLFVAYCRELGEGGLSSEIAKISLTRNLYYCVPVCRKGLDPRHFSIRHSNRPSLGEFRDDDSRFVMMMDKTTSETQKNQAFSTIRRDDDAFPPTQYTKIYSMYFDLRISLTSGGVLWKYII